MTAAEIDSAQPIRPGEELDISKLQKYLIEHLDGAGGELSVEQFPSGWSNLTYLIKLGDQNLVLRRPPFGNQVKSAHDMGREYRVLSKLCKVFAPAPRPYLYCEDAAVIGDEFYVMERRQGVIVRAKNTPQELSENPDRLRALSESLVDCMADLHQVDFQSAGLGDLGRPEGYVQRQVQGWIKRYEAAKTDDYPVMDDLAQWLVDHMPPDGKPGLIHNDFKHDNLMLDPNDLTKVIAVLDWEMATVGDPLMDLGTTLAYWIQADDDPIRQLAAYGPTYLPGSLTRREIADRYSEQTGTAVDDILFYYLFGTYKLAVIVQQIYSRYVRGATKDERFANLNQMVLVLGTTGVQAIESGKV